MRERLKIYWRDTRPMIEYYSARPTFRADRRAQTPEQVREALVSAVASALGLPAAQLQSLVAKKLGGEAVAGEARQGAGRRREHRLRSAAEIEQLARVNALVARVLKELAAAVKPGVTTGSSTSWPSGGCAKRAPSRRSRGITATRRRFARR